MKDGAIVIRARSLRRLTVVALALAGLSVLAIVGWQYRDRVGSGGIFDGGAADQIDRAAYQAVFLTGGQVYFGRLQPRGRDVYLLTDIFYLSAPTDAQPAGQLIKRGNEVHGPREPMVILASQVLLIENQRADSEVVKAIERYRAGERPATPPPPPLAPATARPSPTATR